MPVVTRFAPSPTGPLHLGHAYSALLNFDVATQRSGTFLLRWEDIDTSRSRAEWEASIESDLAWLGAAWSRPVLRQSSRLPLYRGALAVLWGRRLLYPCRCTRRDIRSAVAAPQEGAPLLGPDGLIYPGTCRSAARSGEMPNESLRLDMRAAVEATGGSLETPIGTFDARALSRTVGDVVLARRDIGTSYHLSVVVDDAAQGVTDVIRGEDLREATVIHVLLQRLLGYPTPRYLHHRLIRDAAGKRLAKRHDARAISAYRSAAATPADIRRMVGLASSSDTSSPSRTAV